MAGFKDWAESNRSQTKKVSASDTSSMGSRQSAQTGRQDPAVVEAVLRRLRKKTPKPQAGMSIPFKPVK